VTVGTLRHESLSAELHQGLARSEDLPEACSMVLEALARAGVTGRALLVVRSEIGVQGAASHLPLRDARAAIERLSEPDSLLAHLLQTGSGLATHPAGSFPPLDSRSFVAGTFTGLGAHPLGAIVIEGDQVDDSARQAVALLERIGPALERVSQVVSLRAGLEQAARQKDLLTTIVNALPDPVLLTDPGNDIILANQRAEQLFSSQPDDNEGRRRAIQVNNLLFSSFLTQTTIGTSRSASRELNLVDTAEGSDLLFEVLSVPVEHRRHPAVISVLRDITDLRYAVNQLEVQFNRSRVAEHDARRERDRLNIILENVSDPILVTDDHTNIVLMNPDADRLFVADDSDDYIRRRQIQANDTRFTTLISNFLLRTEARQVERMTILDPHSGIEFPAEVASSKIVNERGEPVAVVSVIHDLTQAEDNERLARELQQLNEQLEDRIRHATVELEERNRRLEWQSHELKKASRLKSEFLANMSHELRTPINVILGYTSLMRERIYGELTSQQAEALTKTYDTSQHLLELINDILDLSKIEAGKMPVHLEMVHVGDLISEVSASLQPLLQGKPIEYVQAVTDDVPLVRTDRTKLKQVLLNLLSNAVKFTQEGEVRVAALPTAPAAGVRIEVADTGIGIRPEHLQAIFEDFRQLDQSHTREYGGTGLGLSITRKLLGILGGSITVESTHGKGTRFTIDLPVTTPVAEAVPTGAAAQGA
jgi:PAS domain S-box-containing protein